MVASPNGVQSNDDSSVVLVDTECGVEDLVASLQGLPTDPPSLYVDLEGVNLGRCGSISFLQIHMLPCDKTYLIDICTLEEKAFTHASSSNNRTLRQILESPTIPKVFFDVRNDSDALFSHYRVNLAGVQDLQLMEVATRNYSKRLLCGLKKAIEKDASLGFAERQAWMTTKEKGLKLFAPERGGSYEIFNARPIQKEIIQYFVEDVRLLPKLWRYYDRNLTASWRGKVEEESTKRIEQAKSPHYSGKGRHMALAPTGWS